MPKGSYSEKIEDAQVMLAGIKSHKETLALRGINYRAKHCFHSKIHL